MRIFRVLASTFLIIAAVAAVSLPASAASCITEDGIEITSADGTTIVARVSYHSTLGAEAPAVLYAHGWGGSRSDYTCYYDDFVMLTWDARGFPDSGGEVNFQSPEHEVADVSALIDYLASRNDITSDGPNDPRVGIMGGSYGGAIALNAGAFDHRLDAVVGWDTWGSLTDDLVPEGAWSIGWMDPFYQSGLARGAAYPDEYETTIQLSKEDGPLTPALEDWWANRATVSHSSMIEAPTLLLQPASDTLFPLDGALTNYKALKGTDTPVRLFVYCGGHLPCPYVDAGQGNPEPFLKQHLLGSPVDQAAPVEWIAQDGILRSAPKWPLPGTKNVATKSISGLVSSGGSGGDGSNTGGPSPSGELGTNAFRSSIYKIKKSGAILGFPRVKLVGELTTGDTGFIYVELVDIDLDGNVTIIDTMTTPVAVSDTFNRTVRLRAVSWRLYKGHKLGLEITGGSNQFSGPSSPQYTVEVQATAILPVSPASSLKQ